MTVVLSFSCWRRGGYGERGSRRGCRLGMLAGHWLAQPPVTPSPTRAKAIRCAPLPFAISSSSLQPPLSSIHPSKPSSPPPSPPCRCRSAGWIELHTAYSERWSPGSYILFGSVSSTSPPLLVFPPHLSIDSQSPISHPFFSNFCSLPTARRFAPRHGVSCALRTQPRGSEDRGTSSQGPWGRCHVVSHNKPKYYDAQSPEQKHCVALTCLQVPYTRAWTPSYACHRTTHTEAYL